MDRFPIEQLSAEILRLETQILQSPHSPTISSNLRHLQTGLAFIGTYNDFFHLGAPEKANHVLFDAWDQIHYAVFSLHGYKDYNLTPLHQHLAKLSKYLIEHKIINAEYLAEYERNATEESRILFVYERLMPHFEVSKRDITELTDMAQVAHKAYTEVVRRLIRKN